MAFGTSPVECHISSIRVEVAETSNAGGSSLVELSGLGARTSVPTYLIQVAGGSAQAYEQVADTFPVPLISSAGGSMTLSIGAITGATATLNFCGVKY
jgi:hypothetical protein